MNERKPLLSVHNSKEGVKIEMNAYRDDTIGIRSPNILIKGIEQNVSEGGLIEHEANLLIQAGNKMNAKANGQIINEGKNLAQLENNMQAEDGGIIINRAIESKLKVIGFITVLGIGADLVSWYFFGNHLWRLLS
ncbi:MAG: hypothetical protein HY538_04005 [Deltaproteobacteria bacterium]|nr:hypothetical protein [Deltaproteobacteria bacterium]